MCEAAFLGSGDVVWVWPVYASAVARRRAPQHGAAGHRSTCGGPHPPAVSRPVEGYSKNGEETAGAGRGGWLGWLGG